MKRLLFAALVASAQVLLAAQSKPVAPAVPALSERSRAAGGQARVEGSHAAVPIAGAAETSRARLLPEKPVADRQPAPKTGLAYDNVAMIVHDLSTVVYDRPR